MDTFSEQLVKKEKGQSDFIKRILIVAAAVILCGLLFFVTMIYTAFTFLTVIAAFGVVFAAYRLFTGINVEYEYSVTNGEIDVDKIIAERKRVHMISAEVKNFTAFGKYESADDNFSGTTIMAAGGSEESYYADFNSEDYGETRLVFSPEDKIMKCIKPYLPRNLR